MFLAGPRRRDAGRPSQRQDAAEADGMALDGRTDARHVISSARTQRYSVEVPSDFLSKIYLSTRCLQSKYLNSTLIVIFL